MRAHCINVYDADGNREGDIWLSSPWPGHPDRTLRLDLDELLLSVAGTLNLSVSEVRQLRDACDAFLSEQGSA